MLRKGSEGDGRTRGMRPVTLAALGTALVSGVLGSAGVAFAAEGSTIFVNNVERLYEVVNDPENAGAAVILSSGLYTLSARDAGGAERLNGGRLDLQADMSLTGVVGLRDAVVIDAGRADEFNNRLLPRSSFDFKYGRTGVIRAGCGSNRIEWLTIVGNPLAAASIETDLVVTNTACQVLDCARWTTRGCRPAGSAHRHKRRVGLRRGPRSAGDRQSRLG